ncbi:hypothetical protein SF23_16865 [Streptomyces sp. MBRL 10]|nr:hypothetical protein SF23_16865 [Streptomyces sp. MBRL 10]
MSVSAGIAEPLGELGDLTGQGGDFEGAYGRAGGAEHGRDQQAAEGRAEQRSGIMGPAIQPVAHAAAAATASRPMLTATWRTWMSMMRRPRPVSSSTAVVVMPAALAAAMPQVPHQPTAKAPAAMLTSSPALIASAGNQVGRAVEKKGRDSAPTRQWPSSPSA